MARRRKYSSEPFGPAVERLMNESGTTYRGLAAKTGLSAGYLNHLVHGNRPVPSNGVIDRLAESLGVKSEQFREYRLRVITERLEATPELADRLYQRLTTERALSDRTTQRGHKTDTSETTLAAPTDAWA